MQIVISGGGMVGSFLAGEMSEKGHTVVVIERDPERCEVLAGQTRALVIQGDGCDYRIQEEAHVDRADVFAAVTGEDDDNLVACQLARISFDVPRVVARVNNPKNERIFNLMGVEAISSTTIIGHLMEKQSTVGEIITLQVLRKGDFAIVEVDIPECGSGACGTRIGDMHLPREVILVTIIRGDESILPRGETVLEPGDSVIAITSVDKEDKLKQILTGG